MAFGVGGRESRVFDGFEAKRGNRSRQMDIACECWFTSGGEAMPLAVKFPDENGEYVTVRGVRVDSSEKKFYCGVPSVEYQCRLPVCGRQMAARLIFYLEECRWVMEMGPVS